MESFKGKFLVRKSRLADGKSCLILCGSFFPLASLDNFDDRDEMWVGNLYIDPYKKFINYTNHNFSPEDFLENNREGCQELHWWQEKDETPKSKT